MAMKQNQRKVYRTMKGKQIDMDLLRQKNELTPAVGNARVNARGDELGPGGQIIRKKEEILRDYFADNPATVPHEDTSSSKIQADSPKTKAELAAEEVVNEPTTAELEEFEDDEWVEDEDGNFAKKGD